jgi:hypothetical protein
MVDSLNPRDRTHDQNPLNHLYRWRSDMHLPRPDLAISVFVFGWRPIPAMRSASIVLMRQREQRESGLRSFLDEENAITSVTEFRARESFTISKIYHNKKNYNERKSPKEQK